MIIYLHGSGSSGPGNHEGVLQLQFIDPGVWLISYNTWYPKHDMQHLLKEVSKMLQLNVDEHPFICGVGLGSYWAERIDFLCGIRQAIFNPNLFPYENMGGKIDRPKEYTDITTKCVTNFREENRDRCLVILSRNGEAFDSQRTSEELHHYYETVQDKEQTYKFKNIPPHPQRIKAFKTLGQMPSSHQVTLPVFGALRILWIG